jgi:hypothetical protein
MKTKLITLLGKLKQGVPQGSVLGPLLFIMYINNLAMSVTHDSKAILFADNTTVLVSTKFVGIYIYIDNHMNWKTHIEQISHKLNVACFMIRNLTHILNADILHMVYFEYFQPILQNGIILGGNSVQCNKHSNYKKE